MFSFQAYNVPASGPSPVSTAPTNLPNSSSHQPASMIGTLIIKYGTVVYTVTDRILQFRFIKNFHTVLFSGFPICISTKSRQGFQYLLMPTNIHKCFLLKTTTPTGMRLYFAHRKILKQPKYPFPDKMDKGNVEFVCKSDKVNSSM